MRSMADVVAELVARHPDPGLELAEVLAALPAQGRSTLRAHPSGAVRALSGERVRVVDPWQGPWEWLEGDSPTEDATDAASPSTVLGDPLVLPRGPAATAGGPGPLRGVVLYLGDRLDVRSVLSLARWARLRQSARDTRSALGQTALEGRARDGEAAAPRDPSPRPLTRDQPPSILDAASARTTSRPPRVPRRTRAPARP